MKTKVEKEKVMSAYNTLMILKRDWDVFSLVAKSGPIIVTEIFIKLRIDQTKASFKLSQLKECGLVEAQRQGKNVFYSITPKSLLVAKSINKFVNQK
jgi:DNA-binding transcriptional ArsR family regulator